MTELNQFETKISVRVFDDIVQEAKKNAAEKGEYENFSHYVRVALIKLNKMHSEDQDATNLS